MVQRFGALDSMRTMLGVLREVSLDEIREQAETAPRLLIVGPTADEARRLGLAVTGPEGQFATIFRAVDEPIESVGHVDAAVVWDPERTGAGSRVAEALRFESPPVPIVRFEGSGPDDRDAIDRLRADIVKRNADRAPAFGRALPAFRAAAAKQVIDETAAANAQFSLVSNIPTILPVVGNIAAAGADFIVLTKNQVMMLYKLAAVLRSRPARPARDSAGRPPGCGRRSVWRTAARQAARGCPLRRGRSPSWRSPTSGRWPSGGRRSSITARDSSRRGRRWINSRGKPPSYFASSICPECGGYSRRTAQSRRAPRIQRSPSSAKAIRSGDLDPGDSCSRFRIV